MEVKDYMSTNVITVTPETTVMKVQTLPKEHRYSLASCRRWQVSRTINEELVAGHLPSAGDASQCMS